MSRDWELFLGDIVEACETIRACTSGLSLDGFLGNKIVRDAVARNLEVIGEAVKHLPADLTTRRQEVDWRGFAGLRDILIHAYFGIDQRTIWDVATAEVQGLESAARALLVEP